MIAECLVLGKFYLRIKAERVVFNRNCLLGFFALEEPVLDPDVSERL